MTAVLTGVEASYSCVLLPLPHELAETVVRTAAKLLPPTSIVPGKGLENYPHITVLYGLEQLSADPVIAALRGAREFGVTLLRPGLFQDHPEYDVLIQHVSCPALHTLHTALAALPHVETYAEYTPHVTLGYVKKGTLTPEGVACLLTGLEGVTFEAEVLEFQTPDHVRTQLPLGGPETSLLEVEALALRLPELAAHPNRLPFDGVLTRVDEPSDQPPGGASGHRVLIPRRVAEAALPSLVGMAVGMTRSLDDHDRRFKVGLISEAWMDGKDLCVKGFLYAKDFPGEVAQIRAVSRQGTLGMSFEITEVAVANPQAAIWTLEHLTFTGAAILLSRKAAYHKTRLIAARGVTPMSDKAGATADVDVEAMAEQIATLTASVEKLLGMAAGMEKLVAMREQLDALCGVMARMSDMKAMMDDAIGSMSRYAAMAYGMSVNLPGLPAKAEAKADAGDEAAKKMTADDDEGEAAAATLKEVVAALDKMGHQIASIQSQLHTDTQAGRSGLATDNNPGQGQLLTDVKGGQALPERKTIAAGNEYQQQKADYAEKHPDSQMQAGADPRYVADLQACGLEAGKKYTFTQVDAALRQHRQDWGIQERMTFKNRMVEMGQLD